MHLLPCEPPSFLNLILIHSDVSRYGDGEAANHEVGGHRPGLTADVLNWPDLHSALLLHLPPHRILDGLSCRGGEAEQIRVQELLQGLCGVITRFYESSQTGEYANRKVLLPSQ